MHPKLRLNFRKKKSVEKFPIFQLNSARNSNPNNLENFKEENDRLNDIEKMALKSSRSVANFPDKSAFQIPSYNHSKDKEQKTVLEVKYTDSQSNLSNNNNNPPSQKNGILPNIFQKNKSSSPTEEHSSQQPIKNEKETCNTSNKADPSTPKQIKKNQQSEKEKDPHSPNQHQITKNKHETEENSENKSQKRDHHSHNSHNQSSDKNEKVKPHFHRSNSKVKALKEAVLSNNKSKEKEEKIKGDKADPKTIFAPDSKNGKTSETEAGIPPSLSKIAKMPRIPLETPSTHHSNKRHSQLSSRTSQSTARFFQKSSYNINNEEEDADSNNERMIQKKKWMKQLSNFAEKFKFLTPQEHLYVLTRSGRKYSRRKNGNHQQSQPEPSNNDQIQIPSHEKTQIPSNDQAQIQINGQTQYPTTSVGIANLVVQTERSSNGVDVRRAAQKKAFHELLYRKVAKQALRKKRALSPNKRMSPSKIARAQKMLQQQNNESDDDETLDENDEDENPPPLLDAIETINNEKFWEDPVFQNNNNNDQIDVLKYMKLTNFPLKPKQPAVKNPNDETSKKSKNDNVDNYYNEDQPVILQDQEHDDEQVQFENRKRYAAYYNNLGKNPSNSNEGTENNEKRIGFHEGILAQIIRNENKEQVQINNVKASEFPINSTEESEVYPKLEFLIDPEPELSNQMNPLIEVKAKILSNRILRKDHSRISKKEKEIQILKKEKENESLKENEKVETEEKLEKIEKVEKIEIPEKKDFEIEKLRQSKTFSGKIENVAKKDDFVLETEKLNQQHQNSNKKENSTEETEKQLKSILKNEANPNSTGNIQNTQNIPRKFSNSKKIVFAYENDKKNDENAIRLQQNLKTLTQNPQNSVEKKEENQNSNTLPKEQKPQNSPEQKLQEKPLIHQKNVSMFSEVLQNSNPKEGSSRTPSPNRKSLVPNFNFTDIQFIVANLQKDDPQSFGKLSPTERHSLIEKKIVEEISKNQKISSFSASNSPQNSPRKQEKTENDKNELLLLEQISSQKKEIIQKLMKHQKENEENDEHSFLSSSPENSSQNLLHKQNNVNSDQKKPNSSSPQPPVLHQLTPKLSVPQQKQTESNANAKENIEDALVLSSVAKPLPHPPNPAEFYPPQFSIPVPIPKRRFNPNTNSNNPNSIIYEQLSSSLPATNTRTSNSKKNSLALPPQAGPTQQQQPLSIVSTGNLGIQVVKPFQLDVISFRNRLSPEARAGMGMIRITNAEKHFLEKTARKIIADRFGDPKNPIKIRSPPSNENMSRRAPPDKITSPKPAQLQKEKEKDVKKEVKIEKEKEKDQEKIAKEDSSTQPTRKAPSKKLIAEVLSENKENEMKKKSKKNGNAKKEKSHQSKEISGGETSVHRDGGVQQLIKLSEDTSFIEEESEIPVDFGEVGGTTNGADHTKKKGAPETMKNASKNGPPSFPTSSSVKNDFAATSETPNKLNLSAFVAGW